MQAIDHNGVKVYDLCVGKSLPAWLDKKKKKGLRKNEDFQKRIELVQDFHFNSTCGKVRMANDGIHIVATGIYPPQVKVYDVRELSMKFERHLDAEVVQFQILSDDYTKLVFLGVDRTVEFHAAYGRHHRLRVPRFGRDMAYDPFGCELFVGASENEVYRIDLEQGMFMKPFETGHEDGVNVLDFSEPLQVLTCGGEDGTVSMWDARARKQVGHLKIPSSNPSKSPAAVTAVKSDPSTGLVLSVGDREGVVSVYDIRSSRPLCTKQHANELPIVGLQYQEPGKLLLSADPKSIRLWNRETGKAFCNIEPQADVNDVFLVESGRSTNRSTSGLIFAAGEMERIMAFYVPRLGAAPKWASFLDNLTEELEEKNKSSEEVFENYKFLKQTELEDLGVGNLIGTPLLRAFMHGYFIDMRLYRRLKSVSDPQAFENYRKEQIKKKMEEKVAQRIVRKKKQTTAKVNPTLAERVGGVDDRFKAIFEDEDFEIDPESDQFKQVYSSGLSKAAQRKGHDNKADNSDDEEDPITQGSAAQRSDSVKAKSRKKISMVSNTKRVGKSGSSPDSDILGLGIEKKRKKPAKTLEEKLGEVETSDVRVLPGGNMEASFVPKEEGPSVKEERSAQKGTKRSRR